jgi:hypothetical protein
MQYLALKPAYFEFEELDCDKKATVSLMRRDCSGSVQLCCAAT